SPGGDAGDGRTLAEDPRRRHGGGARQHREDVQGDASPMRLEFDGLFDLQVNGFAGVDFNRPGVAAGDLDHAAEAMRATGVTRFLPTLITAPLESFSACARTL